MFERTLLWPSHEACYFEHYQSGRQLGRIVTVRAELKTSGYFCLGNVAQIAHTNSSTPTAPRWVEHDGKERPDQKDKKYRAENKQRQWQIAQAN